ncbi:hypothetical protein [Lysinibacillus sp. 54212]|uniref:hypothetical protein n=1 Tax=Lysinibacillus sp. 54212 TaxID=3119829 RepID=UPI002FCBEB6C
MSNSDAKKKRMKLLRNQQKDVTIQRGVADFSTHERKTKTKRESMDKEIKKYKKDVRND